MSDTDIHIHTFTHPSTIFAYMPMRLHIVKKKPQAKSAELDHYQAAQMLAEMHHLYLTT